MNSNPSKQVRAEKLAQFREVYTRQLLAAVQNHPAEYGYGAAAVPGVVDRMTAAVERGSFNKDGFAMKGTCKELGIKYTYTGIDEFLTS